jgi:hypothetical protein
MDRRGIRQLYSSLKIELLLSVEETGSFAWFLAHGMKKQFSNYCSLQYRTNSMQNERKKGGTM